MQYCLNQDEQQPEVWIDCCLEINKSSEGEKLLCFHGQSLSSSLRRAEAAQEPFSYRLIQAGVSLHFRGPSVHQPSDCTTPQLPAPPTALMKTQASLLNRTDAARVQTVCVYYCIFTLYISSCVFVCRYMFRYICIFICIYVHIHTYTEVQRLRLYRVF